MTEDEGRERMRNKHKPDASNENVYFLKELLLMDGKGESWIVSQSEGLVGNIENLQKFLEKKFNKHSPRRVKKGKGK